jgi:hypothetical protein
MPGIAPDSRGRLIAMQSKYMVKIFPSGAGDVGVAQACERKEFMIQI